MFTFMEICLFFFFVIIVNIIYMSYPLRTKRSVGDQYVVLKKK
jgi:hypothetical protein